MSRPAPRRSAHLPALGANIPDDEQRYRQQPEQPVLGNGKVPRHVRRENAEGIVEGAVADDLRRAERAQIRRAGGFLSVILQVP